MVNSELIKLITIIGIGLVIGVIGQSLIFQTQKQKKKLDYKQLVENPNSRLPSETNISREEETAKNYIQQYKNQYPKESIKQGLINFGIPEYDAEKYLEKYF